MIVSPNQWQLFALKAVGFLYASHNSFTHYDKLYAYGGWASFAMRYEQRLSIKVVKTISGRPMQSYDHWYVNYNGHNY